MKGSTSFKPRLSFASVGPNLEWSVWKYKISDWIFNLRKRVTPPMWFAMLNNNAFFQHASFLKWGLIFSIGKVFISMTSSEKKLQVLWLSCWIPHPSKCFFLSLWSHCASTHKVYEILQILTISWIAKSLKKFETLLPTTLK